MLNEIIIIVRILRKIMKKSLKIFQIYINIYFKTHRKRRGTRGTRITYHSAKSSTLL